MSYTAYYGSKHGVLGYYKARAAMALGIYRRYRNIDFSAVRRLVFVCKGNICRSAFAHSYYANGYARELGVTCISAGIDTRVGDGANERVSALALTRSLDMSAHRTSRLDQQQFGAGDLLIGMEPWHLAPMLAAANGAQVTLLGLWHQPYRPYLHDPFNTCPEYLETCIDYIEQCVQQIVRRLPTSAVPTSVGKTTP